MILNFKENSLIDKKKLLDTLVKFKVPFKILKCKNQIMN